MKEIKYFLTQNFLCLKDSRANSTRVESVRMENPARRVDAGHAFREGGGRCKEGRGCEDVGRDASTGCRQAGRVVQWIAGATGRLINFSLRNMSQGLIFCAVFQI